MKRTILLVLVLSVSLISADYVKQAEYAGEYPSVVVIGDINRDGNLEIYNPICAGHDSMYVLVREYDGFQEISATQLSYYAVPWDIGDIDQDGLTDIVVQSGDPGMGGNGYLRIYEQTCSGGYPENLIVNLTLPGRKVFHYSRYTDLDKDGKQEILMSPNTFGGGGVRVYEWENNQLNLVWEYVGGTINHKAVGDFNGNGKMEFVFCEVTFHDRNQEINKSDKQVIELPVREDIETSGITIRAFECTGDNSYEEIWSYIYPHSAAYLGPSYALDFNGDGRKEFVVCLSTHDIGYRYLVFGHQNGQYNLWYDLGEDTGYFGMINTAVADFDQDGRDEFVATIMPFWIRIYQWTETGPTYFEIEDECLGPYAADFNHNGYPDFYAVIFRPNSPRYAQFWEYEPTGIAEFGSETVKENILKISPSIGKIFRMESLYPNEKIFVYDHSGQLVQTSQPGLVDFNHLPNGIYFVKTARSQTIKITVVK